MFNLKVMLSPSFGGLDNIIMRVSMIELYPQRVFHTNSMKK